MNDVPKRSAFLDGDQWAKLMALAEMLEINRETGAMTIRNGKSVLTLRRDGRIVVSGVSISQSAERNISLEAATIDLN